MCLPTTLLSHVCMPKNHPNCSCWLRATFPSIVIVTKSQSLLLVYAHSFCYPSSCVLGISPRDTCVLCPTGNRHGGICDTQCTENFATLESILYATRVCSQSTNEPSLFCPSSHSQWSKEVTALNKRYIYPYCLTNWFLCALYMSHFFHKYQFISFFI